MSSRQKLATNDLDKSFGHADAGDRMSGEDSLDHQPAHRQKRANAAISKHIRRAMLLISIFGLVYLLYSWSHVGEAARLELQKEKVAKHSWYNEHLFRPDFSPPYRDYALRRHGPYSDGITDERKRAYV